MLSNFLYAVRKRTRVLTGLGDIRGWLDFHVFVGAMSPLVIAFHAAFQANNVLATCTAAALLVVMATGVVGRYIYGMVPGPRRAGRGAGGPLRPTSSGCGPSRRRRWPTSGPRPRRSSTASPRR